MFRFLDPADYTSMPWKNGGGRTAEIAVGPRGSTADAFAWRVSIADVARDGAFSRYPGVDRTIVLLEGAGMWLTTRGREFELRTPFAPHRFSGDDAVECTLIAGPVRDFNAMFRRGAARGSVAVVRTRTEGIAPADFVLAYAAAGAHECVIAGYPPRTLDAGHAMLFERSAEAVVPSIAIRPTRAGAVALVVSVECP